MWLLKFLFPRFSTCTVCVSSLYASYSSRKQVVIVGISRVQDVYKRVQDARAVFTMVGAMNIFVFVLFL